jgi:hypothetical protein
MDSRALASLITLTPLKLNALTRNARHIIVVHLLFKPPSRVAFAIY